MTQPFYVAPEQVMKDRADYARKGIARGRSLIGMSCSSAILICAENPSRLLRKISEIYDYIAFAGVGKYNEFDQLRIAGVRSADLKGYAYSREDVDGRSLANGYAQSLGNVFTHEMKPMEVEILVAEVSNGPADDRLFHILYDGTLIDEAHFTVLGGDADAVRERVAAQFEETPDLAEGLRLAAGALAGPERSLGGDDLEVAVLDRGVERRSFRRLSVEEVSELLGGKVGGGPAEPSAGQPLAATASTDSGATDLDTAPPAPEDQGEQADAPVADEPGDD
ncbi:MAG: proteasome subunit alpha [Microthrixaceae bacterium]